MKAKKILAVALAAAMAFSALPGMAVKADDITSGTIYVEKDVIKVTLPTTESQKFYIDPQGLIAIGKGESAVATGDGLVVGTAPMFAVNRSSMPLALSVNYKLVDSAKSNGVTIATEAATAAEIQGAADKSIAVYIKAEESNTDAVASGAACGGKVIKADGNALASGTGVDMSYETVEASITPDDVYATAEGASKYYLMTPEKYNIQLTSAAGSAIASGDAAKVYDSSSYEVVIDDTAKKASCVKLTIGGYCSTKADWSAYAKKTETLKLDVTFTFKKMTKVAGDNTDKKYYFDAVNAAEARSSYLEKTTVTTGKTENITVTLPEGVTYKSAKLKLASGEYDMSASQVSVSGTTMKVVAGNSWAGGTITVTFSDGHTETITVE